MPSVEDALWLLTERGFSVIPVHHPDMPLDEVPEFVRVRVDPTSKEYSERDVGKVPLVKWEPYTKTRPKPGEVEAWWKKWPNANIAVICGEVSGIFVTDADGEVALKYMESLDVFPGLTLTAKTGRPDGYQFYFKWPGFEVKNDLGQIFAGLDIKGDRGYVVAPNSKHRLSVLYSWVEGIDQIQPAPEGLLELIRQSLRRKQQKQSIPKDEIAKLLKGPIPAGQQHNSAKTLFAHLIGIGTPERAMREFAFSWGQTVCEPAGDNAHLQKIVDWALEQEAAKRKNPEEPKMERQGDDFVFSWPDLGISAKLIELQRERGGTQGILDITSETTGDIHHGRIVLESTSAREELTHPTRGKLTRVRNDLNWDVMLERICKHAAVAWRQGDPPRVLKPVPAQAARVLPNNYLWLPLNETTVVFADGGTGKSLFALAIALNVCDQMPVFYLDWETNPDVHEARLSALLKGLGRTAYRENIHYQRMTRPLWQQVGFLRSEIARTQAKLVIADSYGPASMGTGDFTEAAVRTMDNLHALGVDVTRLLLTHISKDSADRTDGAGKPIASVYVSNLARSTWEMRQGDPESEGSVLVRLDHRKVNDGKKRRPIGFQIDFNETAPDVLDSVVIRPRDPKTIAINGHQGLADRIEIFLSSVGTATVAEIAKELDEKEDTVSKTLRRNLHRFVKIEDGGGRGQARWGLRSARRENL